jgi:HAD superfamily hydrolase (TIGR01459 family)
MSASPLFTDRFADLAPDYDVVLCDVWGVVHNGISAFAPACDALVRFRGAGGTVVLITNAPRQSDMVVGLLDALAVPRAAYDGVVSSGDVTRAVIEERRDQSVFHIGPHRDHSVFTDLGIRFAPVDSADYAVCSGLYDDEVETPEDYRELARRMLARKLFMVCANPDLVVERGHHRVYCAGAVAELYESMGGEVLWAGKPHPPIYEAALMRAEQARGAPTPRSRVLAIGDSVRIHAEEVGGRENPDASALAAIFAAAGVSPRAITRRLAW